METMRMKFIGQPRRRHKLTVSSTPLKSYPLPKLHFILGADNLHQVQEPMEEVGNNNEENFNNNNNNNILDANLPGFPPEPNANDPMIGPQQQPPQHQELPQNNPINNEEPPILDNDDDVEPENVNNDDANEGIWNPMEFNNGAELELTWERLLGLDGSMVFLEHVFWVVSLDTLFIFIFAFIPYTVDTI